MRAASAVSCKSEAARHVDASEWTGPRGPSARQLPHSIVHRPRQGAAAFAETPWGGRVASSAVSGAIAAGGRQAVRAPVFCVLSSFFAWGSSGAAHLVLKCAWCRASAICGQAWDYNFWAAKVCPQWGWRAGPGCRTLPRISGGCPDCPAAASTACIAVGVEDFPPRSLGVHRTCPYVSSGQRDVSGAPGARPRRHPSLDGAMGHRKRLPKMRLLPRR